MQAETERAALPATVPDPCRCNRRRRFWLFAQTQQGARTSANLYSLVSRARVNGLEPYAYLRISVHGADARSKHGQKLLRWSKRRKQRFSRGAGRVRFR